MNLRLRQVFSTHGILLTLLFLTALAAACIEGFFVDQPGMMDACYYYSGGLSAVRGQGWNESFLWNYLDDTAGIPHPGFQYWMPMVSWVAAAGMLVLGEGFRQAQIPLLVLAAAFPLMVFWAGRRLTGSFRTAILAGFFAVASGFYAMYWMNTESFLLYAWIGGLILFLSAVQGSSLRGWQILFLGVLCGLAHLTRADGILFLPLCGFFILIDRSLPGLARLRRIALLGAGYLLSGGIWYVRNLRTWGSLFPTGAGKALWLTEYNDLFRFPSSDITAERFFSGEWSTILAARWDAFQANSLTAVFVLGLVFLFPFVCWGAWRLRRNPEIRSAVLYFCAIFFLMTFIYPFQGSRGGFFHSTAALLPIAAVAASAGLEEAIARLVRWRKWNPDSAHAVLGAGMALLALAASGVIFFSRVIGKDAAKPNWSGMNAQYAMGISRLDPPPDGTARFMVNNPPCFHVLTGYPAVPVTAGDPAMLLEAADRYKVRYVVLDENVPDGLRSLYNGETTHPRLKPLFRMEYGGVEYAWFEVLPPPETAARQTE